MSKEVIATALLLIASVIAVVAFVTAVIPTVYDLSSSYNSIANNMEDQFKTDIEIIFIYPEGDHVSVWIKNVGSSSIPLSKLQYSDVFIMSPSNYWNPSFESNSTPSWDYTLVNGAGDTWKKGETIKAEVSFNETLPSNNYQISFFLYNGISASDKFSK
jgi:flagellar protein FlaG